MKHLKATFVGLITLAAMSGLGGCGSGGGSGDTSSTASGTRGVTATVTLPSSASSSLSVGGLAIKSATTEVPQAGLTVECVRGESDEVLATGKTDSAGKVTFNVDADKLPAGDHNLFFRVLDKDSNELAGGIEKATISDSKTSVDTKIDSTADLEYQSWKGACAKQLGSDCVPGKTAIKDIIKKAIPDCIKEAIKEAVKEDTQTASSSTSTAGKYMQGLLQAHKDNLGKAIGSGKPPVDLGCMMKGDAACKQAFENTVGSQVSTLTLKSIATSDAADTAVKMLNTVLESLCSDETTYATVSADKNFKADPGDAFKIFKVMKPDELSKKSGETGYIDPKVMKKMMKNAGGIGDGYKAWDNPFAARAMMETYLAGGVSDSIDDTEMKKRMGAVFGAGAPKDFNECKDRGRASFSIFGSTSWGSADATDAYKRFGPLMANEGFRDDIIEGGKQAFDNYLEGQGGLTGFQKAFDGLGSGFDAATAFMSKFDQKDIGGTCTNTYECKPPLSCSANKKCALGSVESSFAGGFDTACTKDSDCATDKGFVCDTYRPVPGCIYAAGQASGGHFGVSGVEFAPPTTGAGAACTQNSQCTGGKLCMNGGCFDAPTGGFAGGAPSGSTCTDKSQCVSNNCAGGLCVATGGAPNGSPCSINAMCASGYCTGTICAAQGFTLLDNGKPCSSPGMCSSGNCSAGICAAMASGTTLKENGIACYSPAECKSNNCVGGLCQAAGNTLKPDGSGCISGSECSSGQCQVASGQTNGFCGTKGYLGFACTSNAGCNSPYTCKSGLCAF